MWALAAAPTLLELPRVSVAWAAAWGAFGLAFYIATLENPIARRVRLVALAVQSATAIALTHFGTSGLEGALLVVVSGQAPMLLSPRVSVTWLAAQSAALAAVLLAHRSAERALLNAAAYAIFQLFGYGTSRLAQREMSARQELARVNAELTATQELFADSTRTAERLRIARELHDTLGHRLTALALQLEVARNTAEGRAAEPVQLAHGLTKDLLAELRDVVSAMREERPIDLPRALRVLASGIPRPRVHLTIAPELRVDAALAHTLFRCVQETITNAARHAGAENLYITVSDEGGELLVSAKDDGRGTPELRPGNGLTGLRERLEQVGGRLEIDARMGSGLVVRAFMPARGAT